MAFAESRSHDDFPPESLWLSTLMGQCQMLVGRLRDPAPALLLGDVKTLFLGLPPARKHTEGTVVRLVFSRILSSVVKTASLDADAQIQHGFVELTNSS